MFRLVISLVFFIILRAEANVPEIGNPEIRLSYSFHTEENYTVWKDKPLKIVIENGYASLVWCVNTYSKYVGSSLIHEYFVPTTKFSNDNVNILNIKNVTAAMSTRWACTVLQEYKRPDKPYQYLNRQYTAKTLRFNLYVRGARAVILAANNQSLTYVTTNMSVNDGEANYTYYEDGDDFLMDFSCTKPDDNPKEDTLRLEYYNAEGILQFQTKHRETPHIFRSVLKSNNDKYYLDCIRASRNPDREYRYRTTFIKRDLHADAEEHAVLIFVNGQKLSSVVNNDKSYEYYILKYIYGEVLNVTCRKMDVNMRGSLTFSSDANITSQTLGSEAVISTNISTSDIQNKSLICSINNTEVEKPNARLLFLSDVCDHDVRIRGLPRNNILYQYTNDKYQWCIEYQYYVNDTLNLTCVANGGFVSKPPNSNWSPYVNPFQWKFEGKTLFDTAAIETSPLSPIKFTDIPFIKILDANHNGTKIKCSYFPNGNVDKFSRTVEIILRLKPELVSEADEDTSDNNSEPPIVLIAVSVGAAIFIITMVCLVLWRRRTKRLNLIENAYDNLSNQNDSPIPAFPSQWEANYDDSNYAKIDEGVMQENYNYATNNDKLYSMPYKRQSNISENHYTEIDDYLKPTPDGLAANSNTAQPVNYNKQTDTQKSTAPHSSNNPIYSNFCNSNQGTYENLRPINKGNENYSNVKKPSKSKSVTFRQISNDLRPGRNCSEGNSRQDGENSERKVKQNNDSYYANTGQNNNMQPGDMHKKPNYENHFLQNEKSDKPLDSDYAEPYDERGIGCKNDFYR